MKRSIVEKKDRLFLTKFANYKNKKKQMKKKMKNIRKMTMAVLIAFSVVIVCGCTKSDDPNNGGGGNNGGGNGGGSGHSNGNYEYVDLGLPSGTLWATCNVGANTPEGYGDPFAWGETTPKEYYDWNTYQYCNGSNNTLTKYCNNSSYGYNGFTDTLTVLQPMDDAATANWGSGWCMPTYAQWLELYQNTTKQWTIQNDVGGLLVTASNGNSLFLPIAGKRGNGWVLYGNYWSSSLNRGDPDVAWYFGFDSEGYCYNSREYRYYKHNVRAVRSARHN